VEGKAAHEATSSWRHLSTATVGQHHRPLCHVQRRPPSPFAPSCSQPRQRGARAADEAVRRGTAIETRGRIRTREKRQKGALSSACRLRRHLSLSLLLFVSLLEPSLNLRGSLLSSERVEKRERRKERRKEAHGGKKTKTDELLCLPPLTLSALSLSLPLCVCVCVCVCVCIGRFARPPHLHRIALFAAERTKEKREKGEGRNRENKEDKRLHARTHLRRRPACILSWLCFCSQAQ